MCMVIFIHHIGSMVVTAATVTAPAVLIVAIGLFVNVILIITANLRISTKLRHQKICGTMQETGIGTCRQ
jgi:hypothetical protein